MKKITKILAFCALALFVSVGFVGCGCSATFSADAIRNNATSAGYTVEEEPDLNLENDKKVSQLAGVQKIFKISKGEGDNKEVAIAIVFDSINNAGNLAGTDLIYIATSVQDMCGDNKKEDFDKGTYNNVAFVGPRACRLAAKINSVPD